MLRIVGFSAALILAMLYVVLLLFFPRWALEVPDEVWHSSAAWARGVAVLYAAPIVGLIANGILLFFSLDNFLVHYAVAIGGMTTVGISSIVDWRHKSYLGVILDASIFLSLLAVLF